MGEKKYIFISVSREKINECLERMLKLIAIFFFGCAETYMILVPGKGLNPGPPQ